MSSRSSVTLKADTGATGNYIRTKDAFILKNSVPTSTGPRVRLPDNTILASTMTGHLPITTLPKQATVSHTFPNLHSASLLSIGQVCDADCSALFTKHQLKVFDNKKKLVLTGHRNQTDGLWDVPVSSSSLQSPPIPAPMPSPTEPKALVVLRYNKSDSELAAYLHSTAGCPPKSTFIQAIKNGNFTSWPGLTTDLVTKHLLPSLATAKGHIRQEPKNLRSTKLQSPTVPLPVAIKIEPEDPIIQQPRTRECYLAIESKPAGTTYSDLCGKYPIKSSRGNQYILVLYDYDTNSISTALTKSRHGYEIRDATIKMLNKLKGSGNPPQLHVLDNEASDMLKHSLTKHKITYQLVPPHIHRRNAAERAIQTFKAHFITTLCIADPNYPAKEWDRLLPQCEITMNLLRNCRFNPKLSAYAALNGPFDFNRTPLAPPGTKILMHEKIGNRRSWAPRGTDGWYIGPALEHYRCITCYLPETHATRVADTVEYFPNTVPIPSHTTEDLIRDAVTDIISALHSDKIAPPLLPLTDTTRTTLRAIATILNRAAPPPPPVEPFPPTPPVPVPRVEDTQTVVPPPRVQEAISTSHTTSEGAKSTANNCSEGGTHYT